MPSAVELSVFIGVCGWVKQKYFFRLLPDPGVIMSSVSPNHQPHSKQTTPRPKTSSLLQLDKNVQSTDMQFYWMKDRVKQKDLFVYWKRGSQTWGINSWKITHHITIGKFMLRICIWKITYLKPIIRLCTNGSMLCSRQCIWLQSRQSIRLQSLKTLKLCKGVLISYVRTDTQTSQH